MKTVTIGQSQTDNYKGKTIVGFYVLFQVQANANNIALSNTDLLLRSCKINADLKRNNKTMSIVGTTYDVFCKAANFENNPVAGLWAINLAIPPVSAPYPVSPAPIDALSALSGDGIVQVAGGGVPDIRLITAAYYFNSPIQLEGKDELMITVNASQGVIVTGGNASATAGGTFFGFDVIEGEGIENGVPIMLVENIQQGQGTVKVAPGPGAHRSLFINTDHTDMTLGNAIIDTVTVHSEKGSYSRQFIEMLQCRKNMFPGYYDDYRFNDFMLWDEKDTEDLNEVLTLNVAQVTNANNYVVTYMSHHDEFSHKKHEMHQQKKMLGDAIKKGTATPQMHTMHAQVTSKLQNLIK